MNSPSPFKRKPWVFLSHSSSDKEFIERAAMALKRFEIEPWLDSEEIRHGQPWLDAIFENGIPNCDCTLVYLTESSLQSAMVKKEIDASVLQKLKDKGVGFLPYVSTEQIREQLRSDIQAIQAPLWNLANFDVLLPRVVAEIWRSFSERTSLIVVKDERTAHLEAELELVNLKAALSGDIFTEAEEKDFRYIWEKLNRRDEIIIAVRKNEDTSERHTFSVGVRSFIPLLATPGQLEFSDDSLSDVLLRSEIIRQCVKKHFFSSVEFPMLGNDLITFGLVASEWRPAERASNESPMLRRGFGRSAHYDLVYTPKMFRFKYWLTYRGLLPPELDVMAVENSA
ncbi:MAG: toll/interleukin-1 receptor domain-containing protein [Pirellulales bacterium]|nr:toll/interleukin-1 receptor domain-containing protein [Pirellulales bacterium]